MRCVDSHRVWRLRRIASWCVREERTDSLPPAESSLIRRIQSSTCSTYTRCDFKAVLPREEFLPESADSANAGSPYWTRRPSKSSRSSTRLPGNHGLVSPVTSISRSTSLCAVSSSRTAEPKSYRLPAPCRAASRKMSSRCLLICSRTFILQFYGAASSVIRAVAQVPLRLASQPVDSPASLAR